MDTIQKIFLCCFFLFLGSHTFCFPGTLIILNGPSAVGKSTIQALVQKKFLEKNILYLKIGMDMLFSDALPDISMEQPESYCNGVLIHSGGR